MPRKPRVRKTGMTKAQEMNLLASVLGVDIDEGKTTKVLAQELGFYSVYRTKRQAEQEVRARVSEFRNDSLNLGHGFTIDHAWNDNGEPVYFLTEAVGATPSGKGSVAYLTRRLLTETTTLQKMAEQSLLNNPSPAERVMLNVLTKVLAGVIAQVEILNKTLP